MGQVPRPWVCGVRDEMHISELDTPVAVVDLDVMGATSAGRRSICAPTEVTLWPHTKTHKCPGDRPAAG